MRQRWRYMRHGRERECVARCGLLCSVYKRRDLPVNRVLSTSVEASALTCWIA